MKSMRIKDKRDEVLIRKAYSIIVASNKYKKSVGKNECKKWVDLWWKWTKEHEEHAEVLPDKPDIMKCPKCGGPSGGHDRCQPPNPYYCKKCEDEAMNRKEWEEGINKSIQEASKFNQTKEDFEAAISDAGGDTKGKVLESVRKKVEWLTDSENGGCQTTIGYIRDVQKDYEQIVIELTADILDSNRIINDLKTKLNDILEHGDSGRQNVAIKELAYMKTGIDKVVEHINIILASSRPTDRMSVSAELRHVREAIKELNKLEGDKIK